MTRPLPDLPDRIHEGAKVAVYDTSPHNERVAYATVQRVTATQIICDDGHRYRVRDLTRLNENRSAFSGRTELRAPDDPRVAEAEARNQWREAIGRVKAAAERVRYDHNRQDGAQPLRLLAKTVAAAQALLAPQSDDDTARAARHAETEGS